MRKILIINAHHYYSFAESKLNAALVEKAELLLTGQGHETRTAKIDDEWNVEQELEKHQWADVVIQQSLVNWMGVPWTFKKYMDEVYTAGMGDELCGGDGWHCETQKRTMARAERSME